MSEQSRPKSFKDLDYEVKTGQEALEEFFKNSTIWLDMQNIMAEAFHYFSMYLWKSNDGILDLRTKGMLDALDEFQMLPEIMTQMKISTEPSLQNEGDEIPEEDE